jgi:hypothetical protein
MNQVNRLVFSFFLFSSLASPSLAAVLSEVEPFGPGTPNFDSTLTFNQFDPTLGTLNSVQIIMNVAVTGGSLTVDNDGVGPAAVTVELGAEGNLSSLDVSLLDIAFQPVVSDVTASTIGNFNLGAENGDGLGNVDGTGPDGAILLGADNNYTDSGFINPLFHAGYTGISTFDITAEIDQILDFGSVGGVEGAFTPVTASGYVRVIYNYDAIVPEPTSLVLVGLGLFAFAMNCRKR